ncbi:MAG: hypothetical protein ABI685_02790 [Ferruginibacter sp.]
MQKGSALKLLYILHKALLMGQLIFAGVCAYLVYTKAITPAAAELEKILQVVALIITAGGVYAGIVIFKKKLLQIRDMQSDVKEKFAVYRSASIIQWALLEASSLFCIICFFLTGNYAFLALAAVIMFLFLMAAPSKNKILTQLQISESELDEL